MRELRVPQHVPNLGTTKSRILMESARMFALSGYSAVSIRDIANAIGIQPATIYAHFSSKQAILDNIMLMCDKEIQLYYDMMDRLSYEAENFPQLLKNLFVESEEAVNPFAYYALYCASTNQFEFDSCRRLYYDVYFREGHLVMRRQLDIAIERGLVEPFDTKSVASLITNCILNMVSINVGYLNGFYQDFDTFEWFARTINHILKITDWRDKGLDPSFREEPLKE